MKERIKAVKEYLNYFPNDTYAKNNLTICECLDELGLDIKLGGYYPKAEYGGSISFNSQIRLANRWHLTNRTTKYDFDNYQGKAIVWNESTGRLAFVDIDFYEDIEDEWKEFKNVLKSYNPLDYDEINDNYIYDLENGKRLIVDYEKIVQDFMTKANEKIKKVKLDRKRKKLERLQRELEESM